jgi:hypothetical protein
LSDTDNTSPIQPEKWAKVSNHTARTVITVTSADAITIYDSDSEADNLVVTRSSTNRSLVTIHLSKDPRVSLLGTDTTDVSCQATFDDL